MAALTLKGQFSAKLFSKQGSLSVIHIKSSQYSSANTDNVAAYKRGTGGRSSFNGMVATVFGCSGFVGRYVCNKLGKIGTQLILPHRCDFYDVQRLKCVGDLGQVLFTTFDLRDEKSIELAVRHSNVVINLIGRDYETKNFKFNDVHVEGAKTLARVCCRMGVERFIHLSYLNGSKDPKPLIMRKPSGFKVSKFLSEEVVRSEFPDATIIRCSDIYGQEDRFLRAICSPWRRQLMFMPVYGNGKLTIKQPVFVSDVAQAIVNAALDRDTKGQVYQGIGPKRYYLNDLIDWFFLVMRRNKENWGYTRYDMKYDMITPIKVMLTNMVSPAYPLGYLHWEGLEREATTDIVKDTIPTLEDLGVKLTPMEEQVPWELRPLRAYNYYIDLYGEFPTPPPPKTAP